jgi:beta-carotene hydroxylase|tara:strand:+ start:108 stop:1001 length:894 start_codon:yes stop_codon:yes gene_type:complete
MRESPEIAAEFSFEKEKVIAKSFSQRFQWEMILIGLGQAAIWLSLWPLVLNGIIDLWVGFFIAILCACFAYLPSHEAQHGNYSRGNPRLRWLDGFVGHITLITLIYPYHLLRVTHMKHHAYTNDPEKDPDYLNAHTSSVLKVIKNVLDGSTVDFGKYLEVFSTDKAFVNSFKKAIPISLLYRFTLLVLVIIFPLETLLLWWLPAKIGTVYTTVFFSYFPHLGTSTGRYQNTRFWSHWMPRYLNHSMQLHFIHHLHPGIGHYDEPKAVEALKPFLIARKVPGANNIPDRVTLNPLIKI